MAAALLRKINSAIEVFENAIGLMFRRKFPPDAYGLAVIGIEIDKIQIDKPKFSLKNILNDGFLWAVPKHRRSLEKRHKRRYGHPDYVLKILLPKTTLRTCNTCGDDHEAGVLCPTCYKKVMDETKAMQASIQNKLGLKPVESEVVVLYDGEKNSDETWEGKQIVEMQKPRPGWFSKNLLQRTTQQPATTSDVKPKNLG